MRSPCVLFCRSEVSFSDMFTKRRKVTWLCRVSEAAGGNIFKLCLFRLLPSTQRGWIQGWHLGVAGLTGGSGLPVPACLSLMFWVGTAAGLSWDLGVVGPRAPPVVMEGGSPVRDYVKGSAAGEQDRRPLDRRSTINRWPVRECPRAGLVSTQANGRSGTVWKSGSVDSGSFLSPGSEGHPAPHSLDREQLLLLPAGPRRPLLPAAPSWCAALGQGDGHERPCRWGGCPRSCVS